MASPKVRAGAVAKKATRRSTRARKPVKKTAISKSRSKSGGRRKSAPKKHAAKSKSAPKSRKQAGKSGYNPVTTLLRYLKQCYKFTGTTRTACIKYVVWSWLMERISGHNQDIGAVTKKAEFDRALAWFTSAVGKSTLAELKKSSNDEGAYLLLEGEIHSESSFTRALNAHLTKRFTGKKQDMWERHVLAGALMQTMTGRNQDINEFSEQAFSYYESEEAMETVQDHVDGVGAQKGAALMLKSFIKSGALRA